MQQHIKTNNAAFSAALAAGDAVAAVYTPDAQLLARLRSTDRVRGDRRAESWDQRRIRGAELTTLNVEERDDLAIEVGRYALRIAPDGAEPVTDHGKYVVVHTRTPTGEWRWNLDIFNSDSAAS